MELSGKSARTNEQPLLCHVTSILQMSPPTSLSRRHSPKVILSEYIDLRIFQTVIMWQLE